MSKEIADNVKFCFVRIGSDRSFYFDHVHIVWDQQITLHQHDELELSYILSGSGTRVIGDAVETFSKGEVIFLPPNMPHGWYFNEYDHDQEGKIENITIIFHESLLDNLSNYFPEAKEYVSAIKRYKEGVGFEGATLKAVQECMSAMISQNNIGRLSSFLQLISIIGGSAEARVVGSKYRKDKVAAK